MDLDAIKQREKSYHERVRSGTEPYPAIDIETVERDWLAPTWTLGIDRYNDHRREFHARIEAEGGVAGREVLEYGCGNGLWAVYWRLHGAKSVVGCDIGAVGLQRRHAQMRRDGVAGVELVCADASFLPFANDSFDTIIGHGVIHHVIKYPHIFDEIHRVLRPGGRALFCENLADAPLWRLWWWWKGEVEEGDVPVFSSEVRRLGHAFRRVEIIGTDVLHAGTGMIFRHPTSAWRRAVLRVTHAADRALFRVFPLARRWGSLSFLVLEK
jgi:ubiquinone/menaquinone biosynthesis C-methylase UbiE